VGYAERNEKYIAENIVQSNFQLENVIYFVPIISIVEMFYLSDEEKSWIVLEIGGIIAVDQPVLLITTVTSRKEITDDAK
jgi:hypothetical protein